MKKIITIAALLLLSTAAAYSQDIITTKDGKDIQAKILEVNPSDVKYKKFDNLDGPVFTILKSEILLVRYENGENEVFGDSQKSYTSNTDVTVSEGMKYKELKKLYDTKFYIPTYEDPYSRGWAGVASAFIPGLGQAIDGEWLRGLAFFGGSLGCVILANAVGVNNDGYNATVNGFFPLFMSASLAIDIWSICDAVHVAKVKNMYYQDIRGQRASFDVSVQPYLTCAPVGHSVFQPAAGLSLRVSF